MPPATGSNVGKRIADLVGEAVFKARVATSQLENDQRARFHHDTMEHLEREMAEPLRKIFGHLADDPETPEPMREYFREICGPTHQGTFLLSLTAFIGIGISGPAAAAAGFLQKLQADSMKQWANVRLTPQEAATAVVKGWLTIEQGFEQARYSGVGTDTFTEMVNLTGNPPGPQTLITMLNRNIINDDEFDKGIKEGLIRSEWGPMIKALRFGPPTAAETIVAEVEGHIDAGMAKSLLFDNGVDEAWHDLLFETAGEPPAPQQMLELLNRRVTDVATVEQAIRESRYKNKYIPLILEMRRHLMPERTVVSAISKGVLTHDQGVEHLLLLGFSADDAATLAAEASTTKIGRHKEIAESLVVAAYEEGQSTHPEAVAMLGKLGYTEPESTFILQLADHRRETTFVNAGVRKIQTLFVSHHIDNAKASNALDSLGVAPQMRSNLLKLWGLERDANVPRLSVAQWQGLYKRGVIDDAGFVKAMEDYGYTARDAGYLLDLTAPAPRGGPAPTVPPGG